MNNSQGLISAGNTLLIQDTAMVGNVINPNLNIPRTLAVTNTGGTLIAGQNNTVRAASYSMDGKLLSQTDLTLDLTTDINHVANAANPTQSNQILANRHATLTTTGNINNSAALQAGNTLTLNAANVTNTATGSITAVVTKVNATDTITNRGLIDGTDTQLTATTVNNIGTGRIYGDWVGIQATTLNNDAETVNGTISAATIAARTRLDIGAQTINNREHSLIFSAGDMAIGGTLDANRLATGQATTINNQSATIESLGNMALNAGQINNINAHFTSALAPLGSPQNLLYIQQQGTTLRALPNQLIARFTKNNQLMYYEWNSVAPTSGNTVLGQTRIPMPGTELCTGVVPNEVCTVAPNAQYLPNDPAWAYFNVTAPTAEPIAPIAPTAPTSPTLTQPTAPSGASSCLTGTATYNATQCTVYTNANTQYTTDLAAYNAEQTAYTAAQTTYTAAQTQYTADLATYNTAHDVWDTSSNTAYEALGQKIQTYNDGFGSGTFRYWTQYQVTHTEQQSVVTSSAPAKIVAGGNLSMTAGSVTNDKSQIIAGQTLAVTGTTINNIQGVGQHVIHEEGTAQYHGVRRGWYSWRKVDKDSWGAPTAYTPADVVTTIDLPVTVVQQGATTTAPSALAAASTGTLINALTAIASNTQSAATVTAAAPSISAAANPSAPTRVTLPNPAGNPNTPTLVTTAPPSTTLPTASLYQVNPASSTYLVQTDPQFTQYKQWLGSDYLTNQLALDPNVTQKRLGDGFYEQKLIREQIAQLTGQRFLGDYTNDQDEYRALMDSAVTYAKQWNLRPGIALTGEQMARLTSDIVWLVEQDITLADGTTTKALVPQVYLRLREGDLSPNGALIAGKNIDLNLKGDLSNSGTRRSQV